MAIYRGLGGAGSNEQDASVSVITTKALEAATSAANAATSETNAAASAASAATSATSATASQTSATASASSATASELAASISQADALSSKTAAATSETNAANSATAAANSATASANSATASASSAADALAIYGNVTAMNAAVAAAATSETNAATSETNAANSAFAASTSATNSNTYATASSASATASASSAAAAATSESNAANSATAASNSATAASASETAAATSAYNASVSAASALNSATSASTSQTAAAASEANASISKTNAATSATNAAASATNASTSETNAAISASNAATSESNAAASASVASAAEIAAAASFDAFDDRYLGAKISDPSVDNDGNALLVGALYFDSVTGVMKVWSGTNWLAAYASLSGAMFASNNLSDVSSIPTSRSNLGLGTTSDVVFNSLETTDGLIVGGNLTVNGTLTTIDTTNLAVSDNMIYLNEGSTVTNPDLGWAGNYNDGTYAHAGIFRDATDGVFKFYDGYTLEPGVEINTGHASFTLADVAANTFTGTLIGNASTATSATTASSVPYSGLTGTVPTWNQNTTGNAATATYATSAGSASSAGNADTTDGYHANTGSVANTLAARDANGYLFAAYYNGTGTFSTTGETSGMARFTGTNGTDTYGRSYTAAAAAALLSGQTMNINGSSTSCTGNAATATTAQTLTIGGDFGGTYPVLVAVGGGSVYKKDAFTYNGTTNTLTAGTFAGSLAGNASTATYATTAGNGGVTSVNGSTGAVTISVPPAFDAGTIMLFVQSSAPTGWTKLTSHDNKALRVVSGGTSSGGSNGFTSALGSPTVTGSVSLSGSVGDTTLTEAQIPSHRHLVINSGYANIIAGWGYPVTASNQVASAYQGQGYENYHLQAHSSDANAGRSSATGGGGSHTHSFSGSGSLGGASAAINVAYVDVIMAQKN